MKSVMFAVLLSLGACATTSSSARINVHAVRVDIQQAIGDSPDGDRRIVSMGKVTNESAVVYTETGAARREETWSKSASGWSLRDSRDIAAR